MDKEQAKLELQKVIDQLKLTHKEYIYLCECLNVVSQKDKK